MTFAEVLMLILAFSGMTGSGDSGGSAADGALIRIKNESLYIRTGYAAEKTLDASLSSETLAITLTE